MTTYVALLYSVVLPLGRRLAMAELRAMAQGLGLHDPRTIGATGNLTFDSDKASISELKKISKRPSTCGSASMSQSSFATLTRGDACYAQTRFVPKRPLIRKGSLFA